MIEITKEQMKLARSMGVTREELEAILRTFQAPIEKLTEFHQEMLGLPYESTTEKTQQVVMFDNGSRNGPPPARGRGSQRGRSRRKQDHLPTFERTDVPPRFPLTRISEDRLASRVCDDAHRIVSTNRVE